MKTKRTLLFITGVLLTIFFAIAFPMALIFPRCAPRDLHGDREYVAGFLG